MTREASPSRTSGELVLTLPRMTQFSSTKSAPNEDAAHLDRIGGARRGRHRAHERLVGQRHMGEHHVEMALVDRHVDRLADGAAGMVQPGRRIGQLDEVLEILERAVAAALVDIGDEGRAIGGREHGRVAADLHGAGRIAGMLDEFARAGALDDGADEAARRADAKAVGLRRPRALNRSTASWSPRISKPTSSSMRSACSSTRTSASSDSIS